MERWVIGVDVGGTFTDLCWWDGRQIRVAKTPSTPDDYVRGILTGLDLLGVPSAAQSAAQMIHGATVATNALLERKGDRVAFLTTQGFEDILTIGRQDRPDLYALHVQRPPPLVRREDCFGVPERIGSQGEVLKALDMPAVDAVLAEIQRRGIAAVAICLLFGFLHPDHERAILERANQWRLRACAASEILPEFREYERASTTVINAYVAGRMTRYLDRLESAVRGRGISSLRIMQSNGGQISASIAGRHAVRTILSGPAGGVVAAVHAARDLGLTRIVTFDMGGTSTDVALCDGEIPVRTDSTYDRMPIGVPMLAIHTVGAGGGSLARIDSGGALRVGPESAGADPGPACYGRSDVPTVTDAHVVLGRIRPEFFMGGKFSIDVSRSHAALAALGSAIGCDAVAAARAVVSVCSANMEHAIRVVSAQQGYDPADFRLCSFGGAGGLHACDLADAMGLAAVIVPAHAGLLSAMGLMMSDIIMDFSAAISPGTAGIDIQALRTVFGRLMDAAAQAIFREGYDLDDAECDRFVDLRYVGQGYELSTPLATLGDAAALAAPFHELHRRHFGFSAPDRPVEAVAARVRARIPNPLSRGPASVHRLDVPHAAATGRCRELIRAPVWFDACVETPIVDSRELPRATPLTGPAIIVDDHSTTLLPSGWTAVKSSDDHLCLDRCT